MKEKIVKFLRWSEKYTKTDMLYIIKSVFWLMIAKIGLSAVSFITMLAFANWWTGEEGKIAYGTYQFIIAGLTIFAVFTLPGINTSIIKSIAQGKEETLRLAVKERIKWGKLGAILSLCLAGYYFLQGNNLLGGSFLLGAMFIPFKESFNIFIAFWNGKKRFDLRTKYQITSATLSALFLILAIYLTNNILLIITVFLTTNTFFNWFFYKKTLTKITNNDQDQSAISFGKSLTIMSALQIAATHIDKIIIWNFLGAVPVAIYSFAKQPIDRIRDTLPIGPLALPKLGEKKLNKQRKKGIIAKFLRLFAVTVPSAVVMILAAPYLYRLFFPQYIESATYFQALSGIVILSPFILLNSALTAEMKKKALYFINTCVPFIKIILFLALIPYFGLWGIIIAILMAEVLRSLLSLYFFLKI